MRILTRLPLLAAAGTMMAASTAGPVGAQGSTWAESRSCERGGEPRPGLGIGTFHCRGGSCVVGGIYATPGTGLSTTARQLLEDRPDAWDFSVEPRLWEIHADGPAAGHVREGDVLMAVNGAPVTTREAGIQLAAMEPGTPVELTLGRERFAGVDDDFLSVGGVVRTEVVPEESCAPFRASSGPAPMPGYLERDDRGAVVRRSDGVDRSLAPVPEGVGRVRFEGVGLVLAGATEIRVGPGGGVGWWFSGDAVVAEVVEGGAADRAGIVPGEVVVSAADEPLDTPEGVAALVEAGPERPLLLFVRRGRSGRQVVIHER